MRHNLGKDKGFRQVTVMNEKSQGGSAGLIDGTIELVQNRRILHDDSRGVGEFLNETSP
jgi:alpha-mannosidase